ncbi:hypothetical protein M0802_016442 [Mischocyttarus mexicanus]|nr:hypothetical protein M0802_016446 [Mischocyttarus mexicanus]KAI4472886.1 hypothetical protein M0802_016442 [Mischocyttarus mexicanus]
MEDQRETEILTKIVCNSCGGHDYDDDDDDGGGDGCDGGGGGASFTKKRPNHFVIHTRLTFLFGRG